jgi:nucleotide-binding universal stress UspA family protein
MNAVVTPSKRKLALVSFRQAFRAHPDPETAEQACIIVPVGGNDSDERLLKVVERIARRQNANVTLIYVVEVAQSMPLDAELPVQCEVGEQVLRHAQDEVARHLENKASTVNTEILQARSAGAAIVDEAIVREADAIIMSASIQRRHGKLTTGETTEYVLRNAPCEVIVIRQAMPESLLQSLEVEIE